MIALASDHVGYNLKIEIGAMLADTGVSCRDVGAFSCDPCDYPVFGAKACAEVSAGTCQAAVLVCGTGVGMSIVANKTPGIRCVVCSEPYSATLAKQHNDANALALGARVVGSELAKMIVTHWLEAAYQGERHQRRVDMIAAIEQGRDIG